MTFERGQRVECVDADGAPQLKLKAIYTVREVVGPGLVNWRKQVVYGYALWVHEAEVESPYRGFASQRFRPIQERVTDISVFTEMLTDASEDA